ncbi:MAG: histidine phosphatase family protein [Methanobacteriota archaeon]|nr:MAG: histidine phosphatase family protein [Euryarchaeota archaeon]
MRSDATARARPGRPLARSGGRPDSDRREAARRGARPSDLRRLRRVSGIPGEREAVLVLIRHGEIVRPRDTSNFDRAPLSSEGWRQMNRVATEWPFAKPTAVYSSDLLRSVQSATILQTLFHIPLEKRDCLREWTADPADLAQPAYMDLERRAWRDLDWLPPGGESLVMAGDRILAMAPCSPSSPPASRGSGPRSCTRTRSRLPASPSRRTGTHGGSSPISRRFHRSDSESL